jgi:hypothetical protein
MGPEARPCKAPYLDSSIETDIWADIEDFICNPGEALRAIGEQIETAHGETETVRESSDAVHRAYLAKQDDRQRLTSLFRKGLIDERDMEEHLAEVTRKEAELNAEAQVLRARVAASEGTEISLHAADVLLHGMHASTDQPLTRLAKRHILSVYLKGILVDWEGRQPIVSVHYRFQVPRAPDRGRNSKCA